MADGMDEQLQSLVRCPVCVSVPRSGGPVFQCGNGHLICDACRYRLVQCPTCRTPYDGKRKRNLLAEQIIDKFDFPRECRHPGCVETAVKSAMKVGIKAGK